MIMNEIIDHYDKLIDENNDPVNDPKPLKDYMDKWDGQRFIDSMLLDKDKSVLEIGVGTGRLAIKTAPLCKSLLGIDISRKTIRRASENLTLHRNVRLVCGDFSSFEFSERFDVIYSSLTFMHIEDKSSAIKKIASLLQNNGLFVLSIDKSQNVFIDMGTRKVKIYPDNPTDICRFILESNLKLIEKFETEHAHVIISQKVSLV
ncbi:MAG: class I SAM-dependent methyltransferase [Clostridia bacterium]|nr:class I SAM-dependent methyltransferase [Clostridia bacterium]